ncbi:hypothetical protein Tco_0474399 [Tanacetum coccineum]
MAATKSFEDGLIEVEKKLEECFTRFIKMEECVTQMHQEFSLWSDKLFKSVEAAKKEKKNQEQQSHIRTLNEVEQERSRRESECILTSNNAISINKKRQIRCLYTQRPRRTEVNTPYPEEVNTPVDKASMISMLHEAIVLRELLMTFSRILRGNLVIRRS